MSEIAELFAWGVHQIVSSNVADQSWFDKFGAFENYLRFFKPPHWIPPPDEDE